MVIMPIYFFCPEKSADYFCCIPVYSNALRNTFTIEAKNMNPDQTVH